MAEMPGIARPERQAFPRPRGGDPRLHKAVNNMANFSPPMRG